MKPAERGLIIPSLDGLRCVAILPVFLSHLLKTADIPSIFPGNFGVTLFFFLSGYLITTLMRVELEGTGTVSVRRFYLRRALRIFPTFYLFLALAALYGWHSGATDPWWLLGQVLQATNYLIIAGGWDAPIAPHTDVYWSLAVEEHFYFAFPWVFLLLARFDSRGKRAGVLLGVCAVVFAWRCWLLYGLDVSYDRTYLATDTRIDSILFGCALALWGNPFLDRSRVPESTWKWVLLPLSVLGILLSFAVGGRGFRESVGYTAHGLCLISVFVVAIRYPEWGPMRLLNHRITRWIGVLSYAIYLIHPAMLFVSVQLVGTSLPLLLPMGVLLTLAVAAGLYYGIEVPVGRLRKKWSVVARGGSARGGDVPMAVIAAPEREHQA